MKRNQFYTWSISLSEGDASQSRFRLLYLTRDTGPRGPGEPPDEEVVILEGVAASQADSRVLSGEHEGLPLGPEITGQITYNDQIVRKPPRVESVTIRDSRNIPIWVGEVESSGGGVIQLRSKAA